MTAMTPIKHGVGMPQALYLHEFARRVMCVFPEAMGCYLVGSAMEHRQWRDVDVRLMLADEDYEKHGFGNPSDAMLNPKWAALIMAFSALGRHMTGLPIDFQIDQMSYANKQHKGMRSALGTLEIR